MKSITHQLTGTQSSLTERKGNLQLEILFVPFNNLVPFPAAGSLSIFCSTAGRAAEVWVLFFADPWGLIGNLMSTVQVSGYLRLVWFHYCFPWFQWDFNWKSCHLFIWSCDNSMNVQWAELQDLLLKCEAAQLGKKQRHCSWIDLTTVSHTGSFKLHFFLSPVYNVFFSCIPPGSLGL